MGESHVVYVGPATPLRELRDLINGRLRETAQSDAVARAKTEIARRLAENSYRGDQRLTLLRPSHDDLDQRKKLRGSVYTGEVARALMHCEFRSVCVLPLSPFPLQQVTLRENFGPDFAEASAQVIRELSRAGVVLSTAHAGSLQDQVDALGDRFQHRLGRSDRLTNVLIEVIDHPPAVDSPAILVGFESNDPVGAFLKGFGAVTLDRDTDVVHYTPFDVSMAGGRRDRGETDVERLVRETLEEWNLPDSCSAPLRGWLDPEFQLAMRRQHAPTLQRAMHGVSVVLLTGDHIAQLIDLLRPPPPVDAGTTRAGDVVGAADADTTRAGDVVGAADAFSHLALAE